MAPGRSVRAGSTLKPFTYLLAFEHGETPASVVADVRTSFPTAGRILPARELQSPLLRSGALPDGARQFTEYFGRESVAHGWWPSRTPPTASSLWPNDFGSPA